MVMKCSISDEVILVWYKNLSGSKVVEERENTPTATAGRLLLTQFDLICLLSKGCHFKWSVTVITVLVQLVVEGIRSLGGY